MTIYEAVKICHQNKIFIYPRLTLVNDNMYHAYIYTSETPDSAYKSDADHVKINKKINVLPRAKNKQGFKDLNEAVKKTYLFYAEKVVYSKKN